MKDNLEWFKNLYPQNKEQLLCELRTLFKENRNDVSFPDSKRILLFEFIRKIEDTKLPKCDDWWYYF